MVVDVLVVVVVVVVVVGSRGVVADVGMPGGSAK